jgi:biopolymer transport protein ExbD
MVRRVQSPEISASPDLTAMMDLTFNIISFFVMVNTFSRDEAAQRINLPSSASAVVLEDERIPDSLNINIDKNSRLLCWGLELDLNTPAGVAQFTRLLQNEANLQKTRQTQRGSDWKKEGLSTTLVMRVDANVDYSVFRKVMDVCRQAGFKKFQLKAAGKEEARAKAS